ncbi:hypothetical protein J0A67_16055 [Algoriphagus aestuariicola]|uniref:Uncharacterized protein n=1 Tax=Algoriphagus aestuariicola TaxID=1852016 RepID=A0ABS3BTH7_9BACT|nr:hypothetical protein [Algoriphagus aestuariicola]
MQAKHLGIFQKALTCLFFQNSQNKLKSALASLENMDLTNSIMLSVICMVVFTMGKRRIQGLSLIRNLGILFT